MLTDSAIAFITSGVYGHVVTLDAEGSPHVSLAWCEVDQGDILIGTLFDQAKLRRMRADPRVAISFEAPDVNEHGLRPYLVVHGQAEITEGGAPELLQRLAHRYLGPEVIFPPMENPPGGFVTRIRIDDIRGVGPWRAADG